MHFSTHFFILSALIGIGVILYFAILEESITLPEDLNCGNRPQRQALQARFIGGRNATLGIWPWQVSILHRPNTSAPFSQHCGGAIIGNLWILTAAVCVYNEEHRLPSNLLIKTGTIDLNANDNTTQQSVVEKIIWHKDYNPITMRYNIAILKLKTPLVFNSHVDRICLPNKSVIDESNFGVCHITGYGGLQNGDYGRLQEAMVMLIPRSICNMPTWRNYIVSADMECAGTPNPNGGIDGCETNLGGPLNCFLPLEQRYYVYGIRIFAESCAVARRPNVYLKVSNHYHWIQREIENN